MNYKQELAGILAAYVTEIPPQEIECAIETPPEPALGHYAFPCFRLAKKMRKAPPLIAKTIAENIMASVRPKWLAEAKATGAYINIFLNRAAFIPETVMEVRTQGSRFGQSTVGNNRTVLVEYSSPNIAKHFHVGHLGSTMIGQALYNIFKYLGYNTIGINYLGDWGTQFGKLITAYLKWGSPQEIEQTGIDGLTRLYVKFHEEAEHDEALNDEARAWVVRMQNGHEEGLALWRWFNELSLKEYNRIYERLGTHFDIIRGESYYSDKMEAVAQSLADKGLLTESEGARIVDLEPYGMPPCLILRSDGGTLYPTRDIAAAIDRYETFHFHKSLYVTGNEQTLHFAQWMKVVEMMGYEWAKDMTHVSYGLFSFETGKMSTRKGQVIKIEDLLNEAVEKTKVIIAEKNPGLPDKEAVAEQVGIGAVIFNKLYNSRIKDVIFSWERMLNFEGETGPYVQYTHARACSVLERANEANNNEPALQQDSLLTDKSNRLGWPLEDDEAFDIARLLYEYPDKILEAAEKYEPFIISRHLVALAQAFNKFYHAHTVLVDDPVIRTARLRLTDAVRIVLSGGLTLLGIKAPQRM